MNVNSKAECHSSGSHTDWMQEKLVSVLLNIRLNLNV